MAATDTSPAVESEVRAGSHVLSVFENPLNERILRAHTDGPCRRAELQEKLGWRPEATVRAAVANLSDIGALTRVPVEGQSAAAVATALRPAGMEMLFVADVVGDWLGRCPRGPVEPGTEEAKHAVKALSGGWSTTLMRELARQPFTLTELSAQIPDVSYPALERRISWMRKTGQIEPVERDGRGTPYVVTDWLRQSIAPLAAAGRCELRHMQGEAGPITEVEVEASFMLGLPLAPLPEGSGRCTLAVQTEAVEPTRAAPALSGVNVLVEDGRLSCDASVDDKPATWAVGTPEAWLEAVIDGRIEQLRMGGADPQLAADLVQGLHFALFHRSMTM